MAKAVLMSIHPEWVNRIISGEKTIEIRKTCPNLKTPFKCYIYETQGKGDTPWIGEDGHIISRGCGKVVGEFACDRIDPINPATEPYGIYDIDDDFVVQTCLENGALWEYGHGKVLYSWHISELKIYDEPKQLNEFTGLRKSKFGTLPYTIEKAPQSWCYVEELEQ